MGPSPAARAADVLRDARGWIQAGAVIGLLIGILVPLGTTPTYEARATVHLRGTDDFVALSPDGVGDPLTAVYGRRSDYATEEAILASREVAAGAADSLGPTALGAAPDSPGEALRILRRSVQVDRHQGRVARVTARHPDPAVAARMANAVVQAYLAGHWSSQWRLVGREVAERRGSRFLDAARRPERAAGPSLFTWLGLGLAGGLLGGLLLGIGRSLASTRLRHPWQATRAVGIPALAVGSEEPALAASLDRTGSILTVPVGRRVNPVPSALQVARTAVHGGRDIAVLDLPGTGEEDGPVLQRAGVPIYSLPPGGFTDSTSGEDSGDFSGRARRLRERVARLEERHALLLIAVEGIGSPGALALLSPDRPVMLVAAAGETRKTDWARTADRLRSLGIPLLQPGFHPPA